jgi:hypothetical protein
MLHIFTDAEYADMIYVYGFCDGNATAAVEEYCRRFPVHRIPDRRVFSKEINTLREGGTLPSAHVSSEQACQQRVEDRRTFLKWFSVDLLPASDDFLHVLVFHEHVYGEHCMIMACIHFTRNVGKIYTQVAVPCV